MSDPIRVISKIRNNRLMEARERLNLSTREFAQKADINYGIYNNIENLSRYPTEEQAYRIALVAAVPVEELFPSYLGSIRKRVSTTTIPEDAVLSLQDAERLQISSNSSLESEVESRETLKTIMNDGRLRPREIQILQMRYGLNDGKERELEDIGEELGLSRERIRQIESRALRKMRHPIPRRQMRGLLYKEREDDETW